MKISILKTSANKLLSDIHWKMVVFQSKTKATRKSLGHPVLPYTFF